MFERLSPADMPILRRMMNEYLLEFDPQCNPAEHWDDHYFAALLAGMDAGSHTVWLAKIDGQPVGFALVRIERPWYRDSIKLGIIEEFYVASAFRRRGIGRALADQAIADLRAHGAGTLSASVVQANLQGLLFWQRLGFRIEAYHLFLSAY